MSKSGDNSYFQLVAKGDPKYSLPIGIAYESVESETLGFLETFYCGFRVIHRNSSLDYTIVIGDEPIDVLSSVVDEEGIGGADLSSDVVWPDSWYFESCVGVVYVQLLVRDSGSSGKWKSLAQLRINVVPSKLGLDRYDDLLRDLRRVSSGLIFDLVSKNKRNVGFSRTGISVEPANVQLRRIERLWGELVPPISIILESPATCLVKNYVPAPSGQGLDAKSVLHAVGRGGVPIIGNAPLRSWRAAESTRIYEHALIKAILEILVVRLQECENRAQAQAHLLRRDIPVWLDPDIVPGIIATDFTPRIERLEEVAKSAGSLQRAARALLSHSIFREAESARDIVFSPIFQNVLSYNACFLAILEYIRTSLWTLDDGLQERVKRTSRLFEHWVFIQLAAALTSLGLECVQEEGLYSMCSKNRFTLDLDKGTFLTFRLSGAKLLRIRYEPWVFSKREAVARGDSLYGPAAYAWNPDIVVEFCSASVPPGQLKVNYAVVIDAKYSKRISEKHWSGVRKYWKIRATHNNSQVARQVWLVFPGSDVANPVDECVTWGGPGNLFENVDGTIGLLPSENSATANIPVAPNALQFVKDMLRFVNEPLP